MRAFRAVLCLAGFSVPVALHATTTATAPTALSWYQVSIYLSAASTSCGDTVGSTQEGQLFYAGAGKKGSKLLVLSGNDSGSGNPDVDVISLPAMPAAAATPVTGTYQVTDLQAGMGFSGKATITLTYGDANAFFGTIDTVQGKCTETHAFTGIHSGK